MTVDTLYILDPLLATGGTAIAAVNMAKDWGLPISSIKLLSVLGSSEGLASIQKAFPELDVGPPFSLFLFVSYEGRIEGRRRREEEEGGRVDALVLRSIRLADLVFFLQIFVAAIDTILTNKGYISPGVGDAGDRIYGTSS